MVVASQIAGRVRIRDDGLKKEPLVVKVEEELQGTAGVTGIETNRRVGSLLILYDAAVTALEKILHTVSELLGSKLEGEGEAEAEPAAGTFPKIKMPRISLRVSPRVKRNLVNIGMLASLSVSVIFALFSLKKLHIITGILFLLLFGDHFYQRRRQIFA